jgi:hypothetical protein
MKKVLFILLVFISFQGFSQSVKIIPYGIEVMKTDLGKMTWNEAKTACKKLGNGWRLPTIKELEKIYPLKDKIGGFKEYSYKSSTSYWSSTEYNSDDAWSFDFTSGKSFAFLYKSNSINVRAVRDIK